MLFPNHLKYNHRGIISTIEIDVSCPKDDHANTTFCFSKVYLLSCLQSQGKVRPWKNIANEAGIYVASILDRNSFIILMNSIAALQEHSQKRSQSIHVPKHWQHFRSRDANSITSYWLLTINMQGLHTFKDIGKRHLQLHIFWSNSHHEGQVNRCEGRLG